MRHSISAIAIGVHLAAFYAAAASLLLVLVLRWLLR